MVHPSMRPVLQGLFMGTLGAGTLLADAVFPDLEMAVGQRHVRVLALAGFTLLIVGMAYAFTKIKPQPEASVVVPAHVAFMSRPSALHHLDALEAPAPAPARAHAAPPLTQRDRELARLNTEIRALTRQISKAGILRATGKLSDDGYVRYVEGLRQARGQLEARRIELELSQRLHAVRFD